MKTAIVILNWNGRKMLETYLPSVTASLTDDVALVVADNGSSDDSLAFLAENYPSVLTIRLAKNLGFAGGYNEALKHLDAEYFVLLNSDVEVTQHWLKPLVAYMDAHDDVAACQPKLLSHTDKSRFEYAGAAGSSTATAARFAVADSSTPLNPTADNMTRLSKSCGPQEPA